MFEFIDFLWIGESLLFINRIIFLFEAKRIKFFIGFLLRDI